MGEIVGLGHLMAKGILPQRCRVGGMRPPDGAATVDQGVFGLGEQVARQFGTARRRHRGLQGGVEGGVVGKAQRKAGLGWGNGGLKRRKARVIARQHQHAAQIDRQRKAVAGAAVDFVGEGQQRGFLGGVVVPCLIHERM